MVIYVKVKLRCKSKNKSVETFAVVNSAYESLIPEILIPKTLAKELRIRARELTSTRKILADGSKATFSKLSGDVEVSVVEEDRTVGPVTVDLIVSARKSRVLLSDTLTSELGIVLLNPRNGYWCFTDEIGERIRKSRKPQRVQ